MLNATGEQGVGNSPITAQGSSICAHLKLQTLQQMYPWKRWIYTDQSALERRIGDDLPNPTMFLTLHTRIYSGTEVRGEPQSVVSTCGMPLNCRKSLIVRGNVELRFKQLFLPNQSLQRVDIH